MESDRRNEAKSKVTDAAAEKEDFEHEQVLFCSLKSALEESEEQKKVLEHKLEAHIQVKAESLSRLNESDMMHEKMEAKRLAHKNMSMQVKVAKEDVTKQDEGLDNELKTLLVAGTALSVARRGLEVVQLNVNPSSQGVLTISDLQLSMLPFKKLTIFTNKKEVQRTATALGYVAHVVLLVASYLKVYLRYPIRLGGSCSYIMDPAPSVDASSCDISSTTASLSDWKTVDFPLFLEGQDTTSSICCLFTEKGFRTAFEFYWC